MSETRPVRLQLSRRKGFDLRALSLATNGLPAVNVARPGKWGNPFDFRASDHCWTALAYGCRGDAKGRREASVKAFAEWIDPPDGKRTVLIERQPKLGAGEKWINLGPGVKVGMAPSREEVKTLRGQNLACWCPKDGQPCHADVLLDLANPKDPTP